LTLGASKGAPLWRTSGRYALCAMWIGAGRGIALVIERV
jgi:acetyl-CoA acetyltransferase